MVADEYIACTVQPNNVYSIAPCDDPTMGNSALLQTCLIRKIQHGPPRVQLRTYRKSLSGSNFLSGRGKGEVDPTRATPFQFKGRN